MQVEVIGEIEVAQIDETQELRAAALADDPLTPLTAQQQIHHQPARLFGDVVQFYDEVSAAKGVLGRFSGSQLMPLIQQFIQHS